MIITTKPLHVLIKHTIESTIHVADYEHVSFIFQYQRREAGKLDGSPMTETNSTVSQDVTALFQGAIHLPIYNEPEHDKEDHHGESKIKSSDQNLFHLIFSVESVPLA